MSEKQRTRQGPANDFLVQVVKDALVKCAVSGDEPISANRLGEIAGVSAATISRMRRHDQLAGALDLSVMPNLQASRKLLVARLRFLAEAR